MSSTNVIIREARKEDIPHIYGLVKELAEFEKEPEAVVASIEEYYKCYKEKVFQAFVAEVDGEVLGVTIYYYIFSTWKGRVIYLEDFVVSGKVRSLGIGQLLFENLINKANEEGCRDMRWQVLDWNEGAIKFYERNNTVFLKDWWNGRLILK